MIKNNDVMIATKFLDGSYWQKILLLSVRDFLDEGGGGRSEFYLSCFAG